MFLPFPTALLELSPLLPSIMCCFFRFSFCHWLTLSLWTCFILTHASESSLKSGCVSFGGVPLPWRRTCQHKNRYPPVTAAAAMKALDCKGNVTPSTGRVLPFSKFFWTHCVRPPPSGPAEACGSRLLLVSAWTSGSWERQCGVTLHPQMPRPALLSNTHTCCAVNCLKHLNV